MALEQPGHRAKANGKDALRRVRKVGARVTRARLAADLRKLNYVQLDVLSVCKSNV